jgi:tetratricopeptide (TPR) repeat protein
MSESSDEEQLRHLRFDLKCQTEPKGRAEILVQIGYLLSCQGKLQDAADAYAEAMSLAPEAARESGAVVQYAIVKYNLGDFDAACSLFEIPVPEYYSVVGRINKLMNHGDAHARAGRFEEALDRYADTAFLLFEIPANGERTELIELLKRKAAYALDAYRREKRT